MHSSGSYWMTVLDRVRFYLDLPNVDAKYTDSQLMAESVQPSVADVWARLAMTSEHPVIVPFEITVVPNQNRYPVPACIQQVLFLRVFNSETGLPVADFQPRTVHSMWGQGWAIQGSELFINPTPSSAFNIGEGYVLQLWYIPNAMVSFHYSSQGGVADEFGSTGTASDFTLDASPNLGRVDRLHNGYVGQILRVLPATGVWQQSVIQSQTTGDAETDISTRNRLIIPASEMSALSYEIVPWYGESFVEAIATRTCLKVGTAVNISKSKREDLMAEYQSALKTLRDGASNMMARLMGSAGKESAAGDINTFRM